MECVKGDAQFLEKLESHADSILSVFDGISAIFPWSDRSTDTERVIALSAERMPVDYTEPQMILHCLPFNQGVFVVIAKRQRVARMGAFVIDTGYLGKCRHDFPGSVGR